MIKAQGPVYFGELRSMVASCALSACTCLRAKIVVCLFCVYLGSGPCLITALRMDGPDSMLPQDAGSFFFSQGLCQSCSTDVV